MPVHVLNERPTPEQLAEMLADHTTMIKSIT
jgi:hypothetical protein